MDSFVLAIVSTINILVLIAILSKTYCASRVVNSALLMYFIEFFDSLFVHFYIKWNTENVLSHS